MEGSTMRKLFFLFGLVIAFSACHHDYIPKPRGYFRISFPEKSYHELQLDRPYSFEIADYSKAVEDSSLFEGQKWLNIVTPKNNADLHITYLPLKGDLSRHIEDSRKLAYDHSIKAESIDERLFINPREKVYGTIYYIDGNAASPLQFYLTDSTRHFLRGALYIREIPNIDSIRPVIDFLKPDIIHLIETTRWKN